MSVFGAVYDDAGAYLRRFDSSANQSWGLNDSLNTTMYVQFG